jgi:protein phosphatase
MLFEFFSQTHTGRLRTNNEDAVAQDLSANLAILADGMGGYNAGEVASNMACDLLKTDLARWLNEAATMATDVDVKRAMEICVDKANRAILDAAIANPDYNGMGTTLVVAVFRPRRVLIGHIGDSRAYRWREGQLQQLTKDHSLLQEQMDAGLLTPEEAALSGNKNLVTRAMGVEEFVQLDVHSHELQFGDVVLLCSDGLSDMLDDTAIAAVFAAQTTALAAPAQPVETPASSNTLLNDLGQSLIQAANDAGGRDNIAVSLVRVQTTPESSGRGWWLFRRNAS